MNTIFSNIPFIDEIDYTDKLSVHPEVTESDGNSDDWFDEDPEIFYDGQPFICKVKSITFEKGTLVINNVPNKLIDCLKTLNVQLNESNIMQDDCSFYDKYGFVFTNNAQLGCSLLHTEKHEAIVSCCSLYEDFHWEVCSIRFPDFVSPNGLLYEKLENIERILDIPNNLGSIQGWLEIIKESLQNDETIVKK